MAPDDRDRNLDQALARQLRSSVPASAPAGNGLAASRDAAPLSGDCPDAEILAAYHDGSLSPEELALWKAHVLGCSDCQLVLAHLATPLDAPVALENPASVAASAQARPPATLPASPAAPATVPISRQRKTYFRWLVPTGAIAAGLLTWVVIQQSGIPKLAPSQETLRVQPAENRPNAPPPSPESAPRPIYTEPQSAPSAAVPADHGRQLAAQAGALKKDSVKQKEQEARKDERAAQAPAGLGAGSGGKRSELAGAAEIQLRDQLQSASPSRLRTAPTANGPRVTQQQQQQAQLSARELDNSAANLDKKSPPASTELGVPRDEPSFVEPGSVAAPPVAAKAVPAPAPPPASSGASATEKAAVAEKPSRSSRAIGAMSESVTVESPSANMLRTASASLRGPQVFNDPTRKSFWNVGASGSVEFSTDNGSHWAPQSTGVSSDLFTGSAPGAKVCWIVGAHGTILRTIDAGQHWLKLHGPVDADILGIRATDAFHATIWLVPDPQPNALQTYKTSDGALTWSLVPTN